VGACKCCIVSVFRPRGGHASVMLSGIITVNALLKALGHVELLVRAVFFEGVQVLHVLWSHI